MSFQNQTSTSRKQAITTHTDLKLKIKDKFTYEQTIDFMDKIVNSMKKKRHHRLKKFQPVYVNLPLIKNTYDVGLGGKNEQKTSIQKENIKTKRSRNLSELKSETIKLKEIASINNSENITDENNTQTNFRADQQWQQPSNISRNQQGMMNHYHSQLNKTVSLEQNNSQFYLNQMKQEHKVNEKVTRRFLRQVTDEHQNSDEFQTPIIGKTLFIESEQFNEQNSNQQRELKKVRIKSNTNRFKNSNLDYNQRSKSFDKGKEIGKQQKSKQNELIYAVDKFQPSEDLILFQSNPKQFKETTRSKKSKRKQNQTLDDIQPIKDYLFNTAENFNTSQKKSRKMQKLMQKRLNLSYYDSDYNLQPPQSQQKFKKRKSSIQPSRIHSNSMRSQSHSPRKEKEQRQSMVQLSNQRPKRIPIDQIPKPLQFELKDLYKVSTKLSVKDLSKFKIRRSILGGNANGLGQDGNSGSDQNLNISQSTLSDQQSSQLALKIIEQIQDQDWANTSLYVDFTNQSMNSALQHKISNIVLTETETRYYQSQLKNFDFDYSQSLFKKCLETMKYLMQKIITQDISSKIISFFIQRHINENLKDELVSLQQILYKCELLYEITHLLKNIFKLIEKFKRVDKEDQDTAQVISERLKNQIKIAEQDLLVAFGGNRFQEIPIKFIFKQEDIYLLISI